MPFGYAYALALLLRANASDAALAPVEAPAREESAQTVSEDRSSFATEVKSSHFGGEAKGTAEVLATAPGVSVRDTGLYQFSTVHIRGSSADQVLVLLDGLPLGSAAGGGVDLSTLPAPFIDRVQVVRGSVGARYGAGALGGVVNVLTPEVSEDQTRFAGEVSSGSYRSDALSMGATAAVGATGYLVSAYGRQTEGDFAFLFNPRPLAPDSSYELLQRRNNASKAAGLLFKARHPFGSSMRGDFLLEADGGSRGLPGPAMNPTPTDHQDDARVSSVARIAIQREGGWELETRLSGRFDRLLLRDMEFPNGNDQRGLFGQAALFAQKLVGSHGLQLALEAGHESLSSALHGHPDRALAAIGLADEIQWLEGRLSLFPALRFDAVGPFAGLSPKLGACYRLGSGVEARANVGRSFRAPSFGELYLRQGAVTPNPDLVPETATYADAGFALERSRIVASSSLFAAQYQDLITYEYYPPLRARPQNFAGALIYGGELAGAGRIVGPLSLEGSYSYLRSSNLRDDPRYLGKDLPYRPRHRIFARAQASFERATAHADANFTSPQFSNRTSTDGIPARLIASAGAGVAVDSRGQLWLHGEVKNLFDTPAEDLYGYPLPGRTFFITLRYTPKEAL